jgi:hypothetical protein
MRLIRPFQLNRVLADLLSCPGADVANLPVRVVVPTLSGDRIGDCHTQFVGTGRGQRVNSCQATQASPTTWIGHCGIEDLPGDVVVIAAEGLTRGRATLHDAHAGGK